MMRPDLLFGLIGFLVLWLPQNSSAQHSVSETVSIRLLPMVSSSLEREIASAASSPMDANRYYPSERPKPYGSRLRVYSNQQWFVTVRAETEKTLDAIQPDNIPVLSIRTATGDFLELGTYDQILSQSHGIATPQPSKQLFIYYKPNDTEPDESPQLTRLVYTVTLM